MQLTAGDLVVNNNPEALRTPRNTNAPFVWGRRYRNAASVYIPQGVASNRWGKCYMLNPQQNTQWILHLRLVGAHAHARTHAQNRGMKAVIEDIKRCIWKNTICGRGVAASADTWR